MIEELKRKLQKKTKTKKRNKHAGTNNEEEKITTKKEEQNESNSRPEIVRTAKRKTRQPSTLDKTEINHPVM